MRSLQIAGELSRGRRLSEMPAEWIENSPVTAKNDSIQISHRILYMELLEDRGQYDEARKVSEEIMTLGSNLPQIFKMEVGGERIMLELLTTNCSEVVDELWTKTLRKYTVSNSKYSPTKCAILYAYELLYNHDEEQAEMYRQQLIKHQKEFTMPGEVLIAQSLITAIQSKRSS